jgi:ubiquinone/menaquinone biosynthesis C-methylase UbiE
MEKRLHWGCGPITPYGWVNSDIHPWPGVDVVADVLKGLPFPHDSFDIIVSIHVLPEIPYCDLDATLQELFRILKPGGTLRLSLPDLEKAVTAWKTKDIDYFFLIGDDKIRSLSGKMIVQLLWYGVSRCLFTFEFMEEMLARNGFTNIQRCSFRQTQSHHLVITDLDDREVESFFVEASKPNPLPIS